MEVAQKASAVETEAYDRASLQLLQAEMQYEQNVQQQNFGLQT